MIAQDDSQTPEIPSPQARELGKIITLNFDVQGGTKTTPAYKTIALGSTFGVLPATTRVGYDFGGWFTALSEGSDVNAATIVTNAHTPQSLFALWTPQSFTVTLDPNGGTSLGAEGAKTVTFGKPYGALPTPAASGFTFIGWYTDALDGALVTQASQVTDPSNHILYAHWTPNTILVNFDTQGGSPTTPATLFVRFNTAFGALPTTTKEGYSFRGWHMQALKQEEITAESLVTELENPQTLSAHWTPNDSTVTLDVQGGSPLGIGGKKKISVGAVYGTLPLPSKTGYTFVGWNTATNSAEGTWVATDTIVTNPSDHSLYASWKALAGIEVVFDPQGGAAVEPLALSVIFADSYGALPTTTKTGYEFVGWFSAAAEGHEITEVSIVGNPKDHLLYAQWKPNGYIVSFEAEGGDLPDTEATKQVETGALFGNLPKPTLTGYGFDGWFTAPSDGEPVTEADRLLEPGDLTVYAHWTPNAIRVNFDAQGGTTPEPSFTTVVFDASYDLLPTTSKTGYNFGGWFTQVPGGTEVIASTQVTHLDGLQTLYALWYPNSSTVTFDSRGGSAVDPTSLSATFGAAYGTLPSPTFTGYTFAGWHTSPTSEGELITKATPVAASADHTLYAHWSANPIAVTFDTQGGSAPYSSAFAVIFGDAYGILPATRKPGFSFQGWFTQADDTGTEVVATSIVADESPSQALYAHWAPNDYTIDFEVAGGDSLGATNSKKVSFGDTFDTLPTPTYTGYSFVGWYTAATTDGDLVTEATRVTSPKNSTLFAHWNANAITVNFDVQGGSDADVPSIVSPFDSPYGTLPTSSKTGYAFDGWDTTPTGGTEVLATTLVTNASSPHTLFARWKPETYTVTFDVCGGRSLYASDSVTVTYDAAYGTLPKPEYDGYAFDGWYTAAEGGDEVHAEDIVTTANDQVLSAHWTPRTFTVTFDAQDEAALDLSPITVTFATPYGDLPTITRENYTFAGWYSAAKGGDPIIETTAVSIPRNHVIYAHWIADTYTVTFEVAGGNPLRPRKSKKVSFEAAYGTLPVPTYTGYDFDGWYTQADKAGDLITDSSLVTQVGDHKLFAHWSPESFTVTFNPNDDASDEAEDTKQVHFKALYGTLPIPRRRGYDFAGWHTAAIGGEAVTSADVVGVIGDHELFAHWSPSKVTVNFDTQQGKATNPASKNVTFAAEYGTLPPSDCEGYDFDGWYTLADKAGELVTDSTPVTNAGNPHTLYAHWTPKSYTVNFAVEGGDTLGSDGAKKVVFGSAYGTLPLPSKTGYTFAGWFTEISSWILVTATDSVVTVGDHSLFAHWIPNSYTVTFDQNNGAFDERKQAFSLAFGATYDNLPTPKKDNCDFDGWYTAAEGGTRIISTDTVINAENHTLYAHWSPSKVTLNFTTRGGELTSPAEKTVVFGEPYGTLPKASKPGYSFVGWYTSADAAGDVVTSASIVTDSSSPKNLFAHWAPKNYTVGFDSQGGTSEGLATLTVAFDGTYGALPTTTKMNYTFDGWYTAPFGGTLVSAVDSVATPDDHTLFAHWLGNSCIVTFDVQDGESLGDNATKTVNFDAAYGTLPVATFKGYSFDGWFTAASGGTEVQASDIVATTRNHTLYAHRTANTLKVETSGHSGADTFLGIAEVKRGRITSLVFRNALPTEGRLFDVSALNNGTTKAQVEGSEVEGFRITVGASGGVHANVDSTNLFAGLSQLSLLDLSCLDTTGVTTMSFMFAETVLPSGFDFPVRFGSRATNMQGMFSGTTFPPDLISLPEGFGAHATTMDSMFASASFPEGLTFSKGFGAVATDLNFMFYNTSLPASLTSFPAGFGAQAVDISAMFYNATLNADIDWTQTTFARLSSLNALGTFGGTIWNGHTIKVVDAQTQAKFIATIRL